MLPSRKLLIIGAAILVIALTCFYFARQSQRGSSPSSPRYAEFISAFYSGVTALETGENRARTRLEKATELMPNEAAAWANLGLLQLRNNELDLALQSLKKAQELAPNNAAIEALLGLVYSKRGESALAIEHLKRAIELDPKNLKTRYALMQEIERQNAPDSLAEAAKVLDEILKLVPNNLVAHLDRARLAAKSGDAATLKKEVAWLTDAGKNWPAEVQEQLKELQAATNPQQAALRVLFLGNVLKPLPEYQKALAELMTPANELGEIIVRPLSMPAPLGKAAAPDLALKFTPQPLNVPGSFQSAGVYWKNGEGKPDVLLLKDGVVRYDNGTKSLPFPGAPGKALPLDWDYDFKTDLALAGSKGFRLFRQTEKGDFTDVTAKTGLPAAVLSANYTGAWPADIEMDGDLDIVLASQNDAPVLRNNGDGTFKVLRPFGKIANVADFAWGDLDNDGDPDAVFASDKLRAFFNERSGVFTAVEPPREMAQPLSLDIADMDGDSMIDVVVAAAGDSLKRFFWQDDQWQRAEITSEAPKQDERVFIADLDNNGALDVILSGPAQSQILLGDENGKWQPMASALETSVHGIADNNADGRLDLLALDAKGAPQWLINSGAKNYGWLELRPRAQSGNPGDQRINSFGIGGEISIRSGLLFQKQVIQAPVVHFGLGENQSAEMARIVWPNGSVRAEFDIKGNQSVENLQRLTGSCPFLFAWDGQQMSFITDCIWRSPLGLKINAQDTAGTMQTEDWLKIRGDQLKPKDGILNLSVTAELWETHFFDHVGLMSVDHPRGTEVWVDERLAFPQPPLQVYATKPVIPVRAWDDNRREVSEVVAARDAKYLDNFGRGRYQGVTRDHWVEIAVPESAPRNVPLYLIAHGWIHPTDSSINVAIGQGKNTPPQGLRLETPDAKGNWRVAKPGLGFPEGKVKTVVIRLDDAFAPNAPRRARLRTNLEIFWDSLAVAEGLPKAPLKQQRLPLRRADLRYRGFSDVRAADNSSPELPQSYENLDSTGQKWRDLIGYYTRFGDVRPLLKGVDDRYVIMNAGDEMKLSFDNPAPPPAGWVRDWVFIGDGWVKDGNLNTAFSKTVLPLPSHSRPDYTTPPRRLQDDPVWKAHKSDWETYHTRYVTPQSFASALHPRDLREH